ncbi:hypothetical protein MNBD_CPR01-523 [hydrothermal vent metagenome]|uniref:Type IV pilus biogenesis protein PilO n=1 Tax=hydrothermal vent metagenome TaxID=652676 RepID=A0A3B0UQP0_9ZZZZ
MKGNLGPILAIFISLGLYFGYVQPAYNNTVVSLKHQIANGNTALLAAKQYTKREASLEAERQQIPSAELKSASMALPKSTNTVQLVFDLSSLASRSGFLITNFNVSIPTQYKSGNVKSTVSGGNPYRIVDINISGAGSYRAFRQFLNSVEHSLRIIDVTQLSVRNSNSKGAQIKGVYSYQATLQTYWLPYNSI